MIRLLIGVLLLAVTAMPASARYPGWWRGSLPACTAPEVLSRVQQKIAYGSPRVLGYNLAIEQFETISDGTAQRGKGFIDRRYCTAKAWLTNGKRSEVVFLIESGQGFASVGWNVESCLPGYDRWRVHDGWCRSIRP